MSNDDWSKSKSVSFKTGALEEVLGGEGECGGVRESCEDVREGGAKYGHKRNESGVSVNEFQFLLSSPEPEQLPSCSERTMSVSTYNTHNQTLCTLRSSWYSIYLLSHAH